MQKIPKIDSFLNQPFFLRASMEGDKLNSLSLLAMEIELYSEQNGLRCHNKSFCDSKVAQKADEY